MKTQIARLRIALRKLRCRWFGHDPKRIGGIAFSFDHMECQRCTHRYIQHLLPEHINCRSYVPPAGWHRYRVEAYGFPTALQWNHAGVYMSRELAEIAARAVLFKTPAARIKDLQTQVTYDFKRN